MKVKKEFDCVEMKNEIQQKLSQQRKRMSDAEIEEQMEQKLRTSQSPMAKLWRKIEKKKVSPAGISAGVST
jgi:hypothetical protein